MPVSDRHPIYTKAAPARQLVRDCIAGSHAVKNARAGGINQDSNGLYNFAGSLYLPVPNPEEYSRENIQRYESYKGRASFVNFTGHTKDGFMGMINRKAAIIELPAGLDYMIENADGAGLPLRQLINHNISELLEVGANGLLADYPVSDGGTLAQTGELQATIKQYPAESIISYRESIINNKKMLSMVILAEEIEVIADDGFSFECVTYHRVLLLEDGIYKQHVYNEDDELLFFDNDGELTPDIIPRKFDGSFWSEIPFSFSGAINNDPVPDKAPLYDLAEINIAHYRNSADFEESAFMVGQPTLVMSGLTNAWMTDHLNGQVNVGSRGGLPLPVGADAKLLQANPNQMPERGMELKEAQMIKTGAKIISDAGGVETAEAAKIRFAGQNSKLARVINNTEDALEKVIRWCGQFMGVLDGDIIIDINKQFYEATVNPQLLVAAMQLLDRGIIAKSDLRDNIRKSGVLDSDRTDDDIDLENANIDPLA